MYVVSSKLREARLHQWVSRTILIAACSSALLARTLQDALTVQTDDSIQQFIIAFNDLKQRFRDRRDLDNWKIASTMKDGVVQLVATTDRLKEIGEFFIYITLLRSSHV
jgi:hypothetical protein